MHPCQILCRFVNGFLRGSTPKSDISCTYGTTLTTVLHYRADFTCHVHPLPGDVMLTSIKSHRSRDAVTLLQSSAAKDVATQFGGFESGGLQRLGYPSRDGPAPLADP